MKELHFIKDLIIMRSGIDITLPDREHKTVIHRWLYFTLARKQTTYSLKKIGSLVNKDHATTLYGLKQFENEIRWDKDLQTKYDELSIICKQELHCKTIEQVNNQIKFLHTELTKLYEVKKNLLSNELINTK